MNHVPCSRAVVTVPEAVSFISMDGLSDSEAPHFTTNWGSVAAASGIGVGLRQGVEAVIVVTSVPTFVSSYVPGGRNAELSQVATLGIGVMTPVNRLSKFFDASVLLRK